MRHTPALIETMRIRNGVAPLWYLHLRRLAASCKALGIPLPGELLTPAGGADRVHRSQVGPRGATVSERAVGPGDPVRLVTVSGVVHRPYPHKTTERAQFAQAMDQARMRGADDGGLLAEGGWGGRGGGGGGGGSAGGGGGGGGGGGLGPFWGGGGGGSPRLRLRLASCPVWP